MIWLGDMVAGETVPVRAQFHDDTGAAADPTGPFARMETGSGTFVDLTAPTKRDSKTGYFGSDVDTSGYAAGIRTIRIGGTVATDKAVAAVYGFRVVAHRAEAISQTSGKVTVGTCDDKSGYALTSAYDKSKDDVLAPLAVVDDLVDTLIARLTAARAGYLDKLNVSGTLAHSDAAATYRADVSGVADAKAAAEAAAEAAGLAKAAAEALPDAATIDAQLTGSHGGGSWGAADGPGDIDLTYRVLLDSDGDGEPDVPNVGIPGAACVLTSDVGGVVRIGSSKTSDSLGNVTWRGLAAGTYYVWREHPAYLFRDPVIVEVSEL